MIKIKRKPQRSLKTILILWALLFSILPLIIVSIYSVLSYKSALDKEMILRLSGNVREVEIVFSDLKASLLQKKDRYLKDPVFMYNLVTLNLDSLKSDLSNWLKQDALSALSVYGPDGRLLISQFKDSNGQVRGIMPTQEAIFLSDKVVSDLKNSLEFSRLEIIDQKKVSLRIFSKVQNSKGRWVGYLEQTLDLDSVFLNKLKNRLKLEVLFIQDGAVGVFGSSGDLMKLGKDFFRPLLKETSDNVTDLEIKGMTYGFSFYPLEFGGSRFYVGLGASKTESQAALKNVNWALVSVVGLVILVTIVTILFASRRVLRPLDDLVEALQSFESQEQAITIPVRSATEIGLLTESFNQMSLKITQARGDLKKKISELELANKELKETQVKLVHSAKMISLGQLVAGVAHELNNPISFIYSNMAHLRDYSNKLFELMRIAEMRPQDFEKEKERLEFDYIEKDLPKLISSCEDGARRTRDIVLGLRNFSRLDQASLQEVDLRESVEATLELLQGEIKNRVEVHKDFQEVPRILCFASQINQVFMNLLSNALQAIEGPGQIWISIAKIKGSTAQQDKVQISIQDSGKGIAPENRALVFDPFFTTKGVGQGTGLGLSITYGIIQSHGGDIELKSEVGVGTEFIITLPQRPPT